MNLNTWIPDVQIKSGTVPVRGKGPSGDPGHFARIISRHLCIHFSDSAAARLWISSVASGDDIVGLTWEKTAHQRIMPWFDRVDSALDGLSSSVDMIGSAEGIRSRAGGRCGVYLFADLCKRRVPDGMTPVLVFSRRNCSSITQKERSAELCASPFHDFKNCCEVLWVWLCSQDVGGALRRTTQTLFSSRAGWSR